MEHNLEKVPNYVYQDRRRLVSAGFLTVIASIFNSFSEHGTGWPFLVTFGFFFILTTGPLMLGKLLDILGGQDV